MRGALSVEATAASELRCGLNDAVDHLVRGRRIVVRQTETCRLGFARDARDVLGRSMPPACRHLSIFLFDVLAIHHEQMRSHQMGAKARGNDVLIFVVGNEGEHSTGRPLFKTV